MAKSLQEFIDELYNSGQSTANQLHAQRTQADEDFIKQVNEAIDKATAASTKPYQSQIEQLPGQYQKLYDTNAVQELVNRRQVQETMANMGLTDSGLNRTQQTAIALQRGNADSAARLSQQQKTQELQDKIDQIIEISATQKQQQEASVRNNTANWYNELLNNLYNNAVQQGTSRYNTEKQAEAAKAAAEAEARARIAEAEAMVRAAEAEAKARAEAEAKYSSHNDPKASAAMTEQLNKARQVFVTGGRGGLYEHLLVQNLSGILTDEQASVIYDDVLSGKSLSGNWQANIMTRSEFNQRKRANSASTAGYSNYDDYYSAMLKKQYS